MSAFDAGYWSSLIAERDALKAERDALRESIAKVHLMGAQTEIEHKSLRESHDDFRYGFQAGINAARAALK